LSLNIDFELKYENKVIGNQKNKVKVYEDDLSDIYNSRTYCLYEDIEKIKSLGLAKGGSLENAIVVKENDILNAELSVKGMTCTGCEHSVNAALNNSEGVLEASSSYESGIATVKFDQTKVSVDQLATNVEEATGYKVTEKKIIQNKTSNQ